ncbi:NHLP bacteriocin system secretion protein [Aquisphaera insulae]|uniref:NHLP bacteriocin system secretion protein n=1 Tax=Aquisphaera insulae TaxID=2712864 RepID=UPI0013EC2448|nr:NHLP bacteriocin system secretion protein [Aquisphaera insulae]
MSQPAATSRPPADAPSDASTVALEQLDTLIRVTTIQAWLSLGTLFAICAGALIFAYSYRVPKKVVGEGILLIKKDRLAQVRALGTGRIDELKVTLGQEVKEGAYLGRIIQDDLRDAIQESAERIRELESEDQKLTEFEANEQSTQERAIARLRNAIERTVGNSTAALAIAEKIVGGSERLRSISQLSNFDYLKDLQQKYTIQNDLDNGQSRLAELELTKLVAENQRAKLKLQRQLEISKLRTKLGLDRAKFDRTSRIVSHGNGRVAQILSARDEYVREGQPVILLSSPKETGPGLDDVGLPYESIVFVPAGEGKKIDENDLVEIMPATVKREEHGFLKGKVVAVSELPATRLAMEAALQHPDLVETFLKRYAPGVLLRVHVQLERDPAKAGVEDPDKPDSESGNRFVWSSSSGGLQPLKTGTLCDAAIVVEQQRLISLVIPWFKRAFGWH